MTTEIPRRLAIFSDIHANLHALEAVLATVDQLGISHLICCGDVVGYGAFPNECIAALRARDIPTLAGNHDHAAIGLTDIRFFNEIARAAVEWTARQLTPESAAWLRERPYTLEMNGQFHFVHASPFMPEQWGYVLTFGDARMAFSQFKQQICFIGHSHQPAIVIEDSEELRLPEGSEVEIDPNLRYLVNVGSVGQPRDKNPLACLVEVDLDRARIIYHRVPYPIDLAQQAILDAGLPPELAERLGYGW
jgi:diadenosine tetraphosphatase ApaH/serine/threonine PP2A family protein phosphatase